MNGLNVIVAASNTVEEAKKYADLVCTGKNDELVIQKAIYKCIEEKKNIFLLNGKYNIDDFYDFGDGGPFAAICVPNEFREIAVVGQNSSHGKDNGVIFYVSAEALAKIDNENTDVLRTTWTEKGLGNGSCLRIENIRINLSHNQKSIRCIDLRRCDRPEIERVNMCAYADMKAGLGMPPVVPMKGCIGLTMTDGSNASLNKYTYVSATGFYEGIQVGGEHVVMTSCCAIMCFYGFTFGNYEVNCGANHPVTLIGCYDERNVNLPLFNSCGDSDGKGGRIEGGQSVVMVNFGFERIAEQSPGGVLGDVMREVHPGSFRGRIEFTYQPAWHHTNVGDCQVWENDGSGVGIVTTNRNHKLVCSAAERLSYYPTLGQQIFDTDLNKMVACTDPATKKWVDFNGNKV